jgi:prevent-host-death family protein
MKTVTFSEFRNNARKYFDVVEAGESIEIYRHGKPAARLVPCNRKTGLKRIKPLAVPNISLSSEVIRGRDADG